MKKVLITGAGGFAGSHLVGHLSSLKEKYQVFAISYSQNESLLNLLGKESVFTGDLTDYAFTSESISKSMPDIIINLAALSTVQGSVEKARLILTSNTIIQLNLLEAIKNIVPKSRFIAVCSANEYGLVDEKNIPINESTPLKPLNPYAVSKITQEYLSLQYHYSYGLDVVILRPFNHTGEGQTENFVIPSLAKQIAEAEKNNTYEIRVGNTQAIRDFTDVKDMVRAYELSFENCTSGQIYNIGSGNGVSIKEIVDLFLSISSSDIKINEDSSKKRISDVPVLIADYSKFKNETGWKPEIKLEKTLERVLNYWRDK